MSCIWCGECENDFLRVDNTLVCTQCGVVNESAIVYVDSYNNPQRKYYKFCYLRTHRFKKLLQSLKPGIDVNGVNTLLGVFLQIENNWEILRQRKEFGRKYFLNLRFVMHSLAWLLLGIRIGNKPPLKDRTRMQDQERILERLLDNVTYESYSSTCFSETITGGLA